MRNHAARRCSAVFLAALLFGQSCGRTEPCNADPANLGDDTVSVTTGLRGLFTSPDDLETPPGALAVADNVATYRPGIAEPRRGEEWLSYVSAGGTIDAITEFQGQPVAHYGSTIKHWNGSAWVAYSGSFAPRSGKPARFFQASGSLFFLDAGGVYELDSINGNWRLTGAPAGLQGSASLHRTTSETGFATANGQWAYRYVWGYTNANNRVQLGAPSGRFLLTSPANVVVPHASIAKLNGSTTVTITGTTHGFATGEYVDVTLGGAETWFAAGRFSVTRISATSFSYSDAVNNTSGSTQNPAADVTYGFTSRNATLTVPIPSGIAAGYFLQVYRSAKSADSNSEPSDALALVLELVPTNLEIAAGTMAALDTTPDELRGATLYTSLGEQAHSQPPTCADATVFREATFYACTAQLHILDMAFLAVGGTYGFQTGDFIAFSDSPSNLSAATWTVAVGAQTTESDGYFAVATSGSASQNIADTVKSFVRAINGSSTNSKLYAEYVSGSTDAPGKVRIYGRTPLIGQFAPRISHSTTTSPGKTFFPQVPTYSLMTNIARAGSTVTVNTTSDHGYANGQTVELAQSSDTAKFPNGVKTITVTGTASFTYTEAGTASGAVANAGIWLDQPVSDFTSNNTDVANSLMWTPRDAPWTCPAINFDEIGPSDATLLSVLVTRDRLLLYTDRGLYQLTGDGTNWTVTEFDVTLKLKAPRTAVAASGRAFGLFDQGFQEMVESARSTSVPIDKTLRDLLATAASTVSSVAFAVAYDEQKIVLLFLPNQSGDTAAKQVYVLHTDTGDWTRFDLDGYQHAGPVANAGMVSPTDGKLYLASGGFVAKERKTLTAADQVEALVPGVLADTVSGTPSGNVVTTTTGTISALGSAIIGATLYDSTSGASSTITAVDSTAKTLTLASATGFASTNAITLVTGPLTTSIQPVALTEGEPGRQKVFIEGSLAFRHSEFTSGSLTFSTDLSPTFSGPTTLTPPGGSSANPTEIDFWVPQSWQRATRLSWKFTHTGLGEWWGLQGWSLRSRVCSPRTTR